MCLRFQTPTCDEVLPGSCLTRVGGSSDTHFDSADRIGFTLSQSSSFSTLGISMTLASAALSNSPLSSKVKMAERPEDLDLERLLWVLDGDWEILLIRLADFLEDLEWVLWRRDGERRWWPRSYLQRLSQREWEDRLWQRGWERDLEEGDEDRLLDEDDEDL